VPRWGLVGGLNERSAESVWASGQLDVVQGGRGQAADRLWWQVGDFRPNPPHFPVR
jgi:hypothetical protein